MDCTLNPTRIWLPHREVWKYNDFCYRESGEEKGLMKLTEEQKKKVEANRGGAFSTYAYRLIWHEICDTLIAAGRRQARETACDVPTEVCEG